MNVEHIFYILLLYIVFWITNYFQLQTIAFMRSWAKTEKLKDRLEKASTVSINSCQANVTYASIELLH